MPRDPQEDRSQLPRRTSNTPSSSGRTRRRAQTAMEGSSIKVPIDLDTIELQESTNKKLRKLKKKLAKGLIKSEAEGSSTGVPIKSEAEASTRVLIDLDAVENLEHPSGTQDMPAPGSQAETSDTSLPAVSGLTPNLELPLKTQDAQAPRSQVENGDLPQPNTPERQSAKQDTQAPSIQNPEPQSATQDVQALGNQAEDGEPQQPNTTERLSDTQRTLAASSQAETLDTSLPAVSELTSNLEFPSEVQDTQASSGRVEYEVLEKLNFDFSQQAAEDLENNEKEIKRLVEENKVLKKQMKRTMTFAGMNGKRTKTAAASEQLLPDMSQDGDGLTTRQTRSSATAADQPSVSQHTITQSAGVHTTVKSFNLSENVVHESARPALLRFKHDHAYSKCQCSWGCGESCFNKTSLVACDEQTCRVEQSRCGNRWPEELKRNKPLVTVTEAGALGFGLKATSIIRKGDIFLDYFGQYVGTDEMSRRQRELREEAYYKKNGFIPFYLMAAGDGLFIDATYQGNFARYANHSCNPNCVTQLWVVDRKPRIVFRALKDIEVDEPIYINYDHAPVRQVVEATQDSFKIKLSCHCCEESCKYREEVTVEKGR